MHNLHVQKMDVNTLLIEAKNFRNLCEVVYELDDEMIISSAIGMDEFNIVREKNAMFKKQFERISKSLMLGDANGIHLFSMFQGYGIITIIIFIEPNAFKSDFELKMYLEAADEIKYGLDTLDDSFIHIFEVTQPKCWEEVVYCGPMLGDLKMSELNLLKEIKNMLPHKKYECIEHNEMSERMWEFIENSKGCFETFDQQMEKYLIPAEIMRMISHFQYCFRALRAVFDGEDEDDEDLFLLKIMTDGKKSWKDFCTAQCDSFHTCDEQEDQGWSVLL